MRVERNPACHSIKKKNESPKNFLVTGYFFFVMVQVVIESHKNSTRREDLICLDFQGSFDSGEKIKLDNLEIGDLTLKEDSAILVTGHHRLIGKRVKLPKPFAVIHKRKTDPYMMEDVEQTTTFDVVSIVKEKYVFSGRPGFIVQEDLRGLTKINKLQQQ